MTFAALLDANVLVPVALADTLLRAAETGLYRPLWSQRILEEVRSAVLRVRPELDPSRIDVRIRTMNASFEDALVEGWEPLAEGIVVSTDPDDQHVIAAAKRGGADAIVTANLADFPNDALAGLGLHAVSADDFLLDLTDLDEWAMARVVVEQAAATDRPPLKPVQVLDALTKAGVPQFVELIRPLVDKSSAG